MVVARQGGEELCACVLAKTQPNHRYTHYISKQSLVVRTEPKGAIWNDDTPISPGPLRQLQTRRPWPTWVRRPADSKWSNSPRTSERKANFFAVWRGHTTGVFYKWSDCKAAIRGHKNPGFKGCRCLEEAYRVGAPVGDGPRPGQRVAIAALHCQSGSASEGVY